MTDWVVAKRGGEAKDRVGRNDRLSPVGERKRVSMQEKFFLLYAAWVRSRAERPSVSYTKVVMEVAWTGHMSMQEKDGKKRQKAVKRMGKGGRRVRGVEGGKNETGGSG